jgi:hypothetical protein
VKERQTHKTTQEAEELDKNPRMEHDKLTMIGLGAVVRFLSSIRSQGGQ